MADLFAVADMIGKMTDGFEAEVMRCVAAHADDAALAVSGQLYSGIDSEGDYLSPTYDTDGYFLSMTAGKYYKRPDLYKQWKIEITPPEPNMLLGLPPRPDNVPNLWIDGTFHSTITAKGDDKLLTIDAQTMESRNIVYKYGKQILGLAPQGIGYMNTEFVIKGIWDFFSRCGYGS